MWCAACATIDTKATPHNTQRRKAAARYTWPHLKSKKNNATRRLAPRPRRPTARGGAAAARRKARARTRAPVPRPTSKARRALEAVAARQKQGQYPKRHTRRQGHTEHEEQRQRREQELSTRSSGSTEQTRRSIESKISSARSSTTISTISAKKARTRKRMMRRRGPPQPRLRPTPEAASRSQAPTSSGGVFT